MDGGGMRKRQTTKGKSLLTRAPSLVTWDPHRRGSPGHTWAGKGSLVTPCSHHAHASPSTPAPLSDPSPGLAPLFLIL